MGTYDALDTVEVVLNLCSLSHQPSECLLHTDDIAQHNTHLRGRDAVARGDGKNRHHEGEQDTQKVESDTEPSLVRDGQPVSAENIRRERETLKFRDYSSTRTDSRCRRACGSRP